MCAWKCRIRVIFCQPKLKSRPTPTPIEPGGTYARSPSPEPPPPPPIPISEKGYYPLSLVLVTISNYQKHPLFLAFLGNIPETKATRYPPFPRKWEHACSPFMHSSGGPGHKSVSKSQILRNAGIFSTYFLCRAWLNVRCEVRGYRLLCLRPARVPEALCFGVVHTGIWESCYRDIWRTPGWIFIILGPGVPTCDK